MSIGIDYKIEFGLEDELKTLKQFNTQLTSMDKKVTNLKKSFDDLESSAGSAVKSFNEISAAINGIDTKSIQTLNRYLQNTEDDSASAKKELQEMSAVKFDKTSKSMDEIADSSNDAKRDVSKLSDELEDVNDVNLNKAESSVKDLGKEAGKTVDDFEDLAKEAKDSGDQIEKAYSGVDFTPLTESLSSAGKGFAEAASESDVFSGAIGKGTKLLNPYVFALGAATGAVTGYLKEVQKSAEYQRAFSGELTISNSEMDNAESSARKMTNYMGTDIPESAELASYAMRLYGDEIVTQADSNEALLTVLALQESGYDDLEEAQSVLNKSTKLWNLSLEEGTGVLTTQSRLMQTYGKAADDLGDSIVEFGDTFVGAGVGAEQFFNIVETGLLLGARNTDEVVNAVNELIIKSGEGSDAFAQAATDIGSSSDELKDAIDDGRIGEALVTIINGLSEMEDQTARTAAAGALMGTYGEEFIAPVASSKENVDALNEAMGILQTRQETLVEVNSVFGESLGMLSEGLGLSTIQTENLNTAYDEGLEPALAYLQSQGELTNAFGLLGEKLGLTKEQMSLFSEAQTIAGEQGAVAAAAFLNENGMLQMLADKGLIAQGRVDTLSEAQAGLSESSDYTKKRISDLNTKIIENGDSLGISQRASKNYESALTTLSSETATTKQKQQALITVSGTLSNAFNLNKKDANTLRSSLGVLSSETATTELKVSALKGVLEVLSNNGFQPSTKNADLMKSSLGKLESSMDLSESAGGSLTDQLVEVGKSSATSTKDIDKIKDSIKGSITPMDRLKGKSKESASELLSMGSSANDADVELGDLVSQIGTYNKTTLEDKETTITTNKVTKTKTIDQGTEKAGKSIRYVPQSGYSPDLKALRATPDERALEAVDAGASVRIDNRRYLNFTVERVVAESPTDFVSEMRNFIENEGNELFGEL